MRKADENIRNLCERVIKAKEQQEFDEAITALQSALREHVVTAENKHIARLLKLRKDTTGR